MRLGLMLMMSHAFISMAQRACSGETMLSSRQSGERSMRLELGVVEDVVVRQRLLDQQQVEGVEFGQVRGVGQVIDAVGVDLQQQVGPRLAHGAASARCPSPA